MIDITVHRGAHQIGGCITAISTKNCKVIIDLGSNLPGSASADFSAAEIVDITKNADAIFYTHYHGDHVGLFKYVPSSIPQFIGKGAQEVMVCKYETLKETDCKETAQRLRTYEPSRCMDVAGKGHIFITPYFVSHSAFDAYMFKIECEGQVILHTGDFRRHGYLGKGLFPVLKKLVGRVDVLITEGTMLGRMQEKVLSENDIKINVSRLLKQHKYVFALCSSTDMDRLASFHAACKEAHRTFVVDEYQANVLNIFSKYAGHKADLFNFNKVFRLINYKTEKVKKYLSQTGFFMPIRASQLKLLKAIMAEYPDEPAWLIYSMWKGYAEENKPYTNHQIQAIRNYFEDRIMDGTKDGFHTSGHADVNTIKDVCEIVSPRLGIIPIHKEENTYLESILGLETYPIFHEGETHLDQINISVQ